MVRTLLGVRANTSIKLCLVESGLEPFDHIVKKKRASFLKEKLNLADMEHPFHQMLAICRSAHAPCATFIARATEYNQQSKRNELITSIQGNEGSKFFNYRRKLNAALAVHPLYASDQYVPDFVRVSFTRLRLMSLGLKVETERWSRIPREERRCDRCDTEAVQDEEHVLIACSHAQDIRLRYPSLDFSSMDELMDGEDHRKLAEFVNAILEYFK